MWTKPPTYEKISFHNYCNDNIKAFKDHLHNTNLDPIFKCNDVNIAVSILDAKLNDNHDHFFPLKTVKKHPKFIYKPSNESHNAIKTKKKLYRKFKVLLKKVTDSNYNKCNVCANCIKANKVIPKVVSMNICMLQNLMNISVTLAQI